MVEGPGRVRYSLSGGVLPKSYLDAINAVCVGQGWYSEGDAELVSATLQDAVVVRNHLGWRPFPRNGLNFEAGYGFVGLGGGLTGAKVLSLVAQREIPEALDGGLSFSAAAALHQFDATVGYDARLYRGLHLRIDLGAAVTLASTTVIEPDFDVPWVAEGAVDELTTAGEEDLDTIFLSYVHLPTLGVMLGWRF